MFLPVSPEQLAHLRNVAQLLVERTGEHEGHLQSAVTAAEQDVQQAEAAAASATRGVDLRRLLVAQLERSETSLATARRLCVSGRQQHAAALRLLKYLDGERRTSERRSTAVLVVDDHDEIRGLVAHALHRAGFVVRTASNGLEALIAAYEMRPRVILMDVTMPVLDGIEATRLIKSIETTRHARIIAHTGNASLDDRLIGTLFDAVVQKPATPDLVLAAVQQVAAS
jgi:CheY-like chemotaxis protein